MIRCWWMAFLPLISKAQLFFPAPAFDCSRIHPRYCCSSRVRISCPQLCAQRPCSRTPTFVQPFSPHIPPTLPFPGLAPQPQVPQPQLPQPQVSQIPEQPRLPTLINPTGLTSALTSSVESRQPLLPDPPPGIVLPPVEVPLAIGDEQTEGGQSTENSAKIQPIDGFAPAVHNRQIGAVGAGGTFAPNGFLAPVPSPTSSPFPRPTSIFPATQNTFPTLINFIPSTTTMPPSIAPPWPEVPTHQVTTSVPTTKSPLVDSNSRSHKKPFIPPPNRFVTEKGEELVELESTDRRAIHIDSHAAVENARSRSKDTFPAGIEGLESGIAKTIILGPHTSPSPVSSNSVSFNSSEQIVEIQEKAEPMARTTIPERRSDNGSWSFKITPSKLSKDWLTSRSNEEAISNLNASSQWIGPPSQSSGIFQGDKFNGLINSIFTRRTIDSITSLTGKRPPRPKSGNVVSATAPPPFVETTTFAFRNQTVDWRSASGSETQCGTAPNFVPCLDLDRANLRLLACCRSKLPEGCWSLCRYDTTQADIKSAFDAGKCGILNVAPFLDCASQGQDNRQCCQQRMISAKSGPQCEVFCHPRDGLGSLGIQHLQCQSVISDLLQCHHSGLKP